MSHKRYFGTPLIRSSHRDGIHATRAPSVRGNEAFQELPPRPSGNLRLDLETILGANDIAAIKKAKKLVFHTAGDTGGVKDAVPQTIVAKKMVEQLHVPVAGRPAFFYHLGDVVYFKGEAKEYFPQFYEAYEYYDAPIFAIPGNHDGINPGDGATPLDAYMRNFCAPPGSGFTPEAVDVQRTPMTQPYCYFTLNTPFVTFIGLYTNVPSGGRLKDDQIQWLVDELKAAPANRALILALHHPIYSSDDHHSGNEKLEQIIHDAFGAAKRIPNAVLTAHVHNYQRFTRFFGRKQVPYFVIGAGGYHNLHGMLKAPDGGELPVPHQITEEPQLILEDYVKSRHGFSRVTASAEELLFEYFTVPRPHESWSSAAERYDTCRLDWKNGVILPS